MALSTLWETYGLWLLGIPAAILLLIIVFAAARRNRDDLDWELARGREPRLQGGNRRAYAQAYRDDGRGGGGRGSGQSGFRPPGILPRLVWLVVGGAVGVAGGLVWLNPDTVARFEPVVAALARQIEAVVNSVASTEPQPQTATAPVPAADAANGTSGEGAPTVSTNPPEQSATSDTRSELDALATAFVADLQPQLPLPIRPGVAIVAAEALGDVVYLMVQFAEIMADEDIQTLQVGLESNFRADLCALEPNPTNIRGLNDRGLALQIIYADSIGRTVAELTVKPKFCGSSD